MNLYISLSINFPLVSPVTRQAGEECGPCFSPDTNFFCGTCEEGLECVKDSSNSLLPDAPARCRQKPGYQFL